MPACSRHTPGFLQLFLCRYLYVCMCICVCMCVCPPQMLLITSGVMWCDMDSILLVKQALQLLYGNCSHYLLYKAEKPSVCLSVHLHFWHADNSAVFASIETGLARNESCVFKQQKFISTSLQNPLFINRSV